ncbi:hypothetical protein [Actinophytocola oryzae]|nr:hypothetical protein [Actinophytocola oryzae]
MSNRLTDQALEQRCQQLAAIYDEVHDAEEASARRRRYAARVDRLVPE